LSRCGEDQQAESACQPTHSSHRFLYGLGLSGACIPASGIYPFRSPGRPEATSAEHGVLLSSVQRRHCYPVPVSVDEVHVRAKPPGRIEQHDTATSRRELPGSAVLVRRRPVVRKLYRWPRSNLLVTRIRSPR
jgi:hypothetical protein